MNLSQFSSELRITRVWRKENFLFLSLSLSLSLNLEANEFVTLSPKFYSKWRFYVVRHRRSFLKLDCEILNASKKEEGISSRYEKTKSQERKIFLPGGGRWSEDMSEKISSLVKWRKIYTVRSFFLSFFSSRHTREMARFPSETLLFRNNAINRNG